MYLINAMFVLQEVYMLKQSCHATLEQNIRPTITLHQQKTPATTGSQEHTYMMLVTKYQISAINNY
jgi:hypothetical protein